MNNYDQILDMLLLQEAAEPRLVITSSTSPSAIRKALKSRLQQFNASQEVLGLDVVYPYVSVNGNPDGDGYKMTIKLKKSLDNELNFKFTILDSEDNNNEQN